MLAATFCACAMLGAAGDAAGFAKQPTIPGVGLILDRGHPAGSAWGGVTADLSVRK